MIMLLKTAVLLAILSLNGDIVGTNGIDIALQPKQKQLLGLIEHSNYETIGYGGARGGAKSHAIRDMAVYFGLKYGVSQLIFRRVRQDLMDNHVYPLLEAYPALRKYYNKQENIVFHPRTRQPMIRFGYAEYEQDIISFQGKEYAIIYVDEATQSTQKMIEFLGTSNRDSQGRLPTRPKVVLTMNPGGVGHSFIKRIFIDRTYLENENPDSYAFIQAHVWDNVFWVVDQLYKDGFTVEDYYKLWTEEQRTDYCLEHSDYAKKLSYLPSEMRKAHLFGDWDVYGGMFFKTFDQTRQIIKPFEIDLNWTFIGSLDPGFSAPCSFGLLAKDFAGNVYRIATYYEDQTKPIDHARNIRTFCTSPPVSKYTMGRIPRVVVSGRDAWARKDRFSVTASDVTFRDLLDDQGFSLVRANTARVQGWWAVKNLFPDVQDRSDLGHFFVFDQFNQPFVNETISVESDPKRPEDIKGRGNDSEVPDHSLDENRYGIMYLEAPPKPEPVDKHAGKDPKLVKEYETSDPRNFWENQ